LINNISKRKDNHSRGLSTGWSQ